ncbi:hypothetical protein K502DRAFT_61477 [Neoconidiobolus thromboides FSU 785]|nr:hypothetical protein K502DRAFT_61477 [Neoconidiobolus thromboides FSU 785]
MSEYLREYNDEEISRLKSPNKEEEEEVELEDESFSERNTEFTRILITFGEQGYQTDKSKEAWKNPDLLTQLYQRHLGKFNESYKNIRSTTFNPIKIFSDYVDFVNEYYPLGTTRPKEFILNLEKGINYIVNDTRASVRALHETLRIFLTYSKYLIDPTNLFAFMLANGIGTEHDEFFLQFSLAFDRKLNFAASEEVFLRGVLMKPYLSPKLMVHYNDGLIRYKNLMEALEALNLITIAPAMQLRQNEYTQRYHHTFSNPTGGPLCLTNTEVNPDPIFRRVNGKYKIIPMHIQSKRRLKDQLMGAEVSLVYRRCEELANLEHPENLVLDLEYNNIPLKYIPFKCNFYLILILFN